MAIVEELEVRADANPAVVALKKLDATVARTFATISSKATAASKTVRDELGGALTKQIALGGLVAGAVQNAFGLITSAINSSVQAALEYERTTQQQIATLRLYGLDIAGVAEALEAQSTSIERITGIAQEQIRTWQSRAISLGVNVDATDELIKASVGLSNVMGKDVNEMMNQLIKSQSGQVEETLRMIPAIRDLTSEQLKNGDAIRVINEQYGEFASMATTGGGTAANINELANAWGNFGKAVARTATESDTATSITHRLADSLLVLQTAAEGMQSLGAKFKDNWLSKALDAAENINPVVANFGLLSEVIGVLSSKIKENQDASAEAADSVLGQVVAGQEVTVSGLTFNLDKIRKEMAAEIVRVKQLQTDFEQATEAAWQAHFARMQAAQQVAAAQQPRAIQGPAPLGEEQLEIGERRRALMSELGELPTLAETQYAQYAAVVQTAEEGLSQIVSDNEIRRAEIRMESEESQLAASMAMYSSLASVAMNGASAATNAILGALESLAVGEDVAMGKILRSFMRGVGSQTLASGAAHMVQALANMWFPATAALGAVQAKVAGAELAIGAALFGGNLALASAGVGGSGGGGGGGRVSGGTGQFSTGSIGGFGSSSRSERGTDANITIVVQGVATKAEVGVAIREALDAAKRVGV